MELVKTHGFVGRKVAETTIDGRVAVIICTGTSARDMRVVTERIWDADETDAMDELEGRLICLIEDYQAIGLTDDNIRTAMRHAYLERIAKLPVDR